MRGAIVGVALLIQATGPALATVSGLAAVTGLPTAVVSDVPTAAVSNVPTAEVSDVPTAAESNMRTDAVSGVQTAASSNVQSTAVLDVHTATESNLRTDPVSGVPTAASSNVQTATVSGVLTDAVEDAWLAAEPLPGPPGAAAPGTAAPGTAAPGTAAPGTVRPAWIDALPEALGRLYALGSADLGGNEGQAIARASDRARLEVVARLRTSVKGRTSVATRTSETQRDGVKGAASGERQIRDEVTVAAQAQDLPGLVVERTHVDPQGRTAFALAYLDLVQAERALAGRLALIRDGRARFGTEASRRARWQLRKFKGDAERLQESLDLLALTGAGADLRTTLQGERQALEARLAVLDGAELPAVDLARTSVALRSNIDLPAGVEAYLASRITACGPQVRELNPDLILDLTFAGGAKGPELIYVDMDIYSGVTYRIQAQLELQDASGIPVAKAIALQVAQGQSPEGMIEQFRRLFERRLPRLFAEYQTEMK